MVCYRFNRYYRIRPLIDSNYLKKNRHCLRVRVLFTNAPFGTGNIP